MADHFRPPAQQTALKKHRCEGCWWAIPSGESYVEQTGFFDGGAFRNRFHQECWDALVFGANGDFEFTPGDCEPPARLQEVAP